MIKNRKLIVILVVTCVAILAIWRITTFIIERAEYIKANQWKQDFEVTYEWVEGSDVRDYASAYDVLVAYANKEFVLPHHKYTIKNITNNTLVNVVAVFEFKVYYEEPLEYRKKLGLAGYLQPGETDICEISDALIVTAAEMEGLYINDSDIESVKLVRIEYDVAQ